MEDYYLVDDENSDYDNSSDSDEETLQLVDATLQSKYLQSGDGREMSFEQEMEKERNELFERKFTANGSSVLQKANKRITKKVQTIVEENEDSSESGSKVNTMDTDDEISQDSNSNDLLLYDPKADDKDERWVANLRFDYLKNVKSATPTGGECSSQVNNSDATLNCPFCMSLLCLDCQRHEQYRNQYRAMFVYNCFVDFQTKLEYKEKTCKYRKLKQKMNLSTNANKIEIYYPVKCTICSTQVAVYDSNEVYHFFNVLTSN